MTAADIIKAGLLGTEKYMPEPSGPLLETGERIVRQQGSREDHFLKMAAVTLLYAEAGRMPAALQSSLPACPEEQLPLAGEKETALLQSAVEAKEEVLFQYQLFRLHQQGNVLPAYLAPAMLNKALEQKNQAASLVAACGEAGQWLCRLNEDWQVLLDDSKEEDVWETGSLEGRKRYLRQLRKTSPATAIALLEAAFPKENAATRLAFAELLPEELSLLDEAFLQSLLKDKSQKVKDTAQDYLKRMQGSALNKSYLELLLQVMSFKEERHLLISKKKVFTIREDIPVPEELLKTGIDKVSSDKDLPDHIYIAGQLITCIDPAILAARLGTTPQELIALCLQHKQAKALLPFLVQAAINYSNRDWALALLQNGTTADIQLLTVLPEQERPDFYAQFLEGDMQALLSFLLDPAYTVMPLSLAGPLLDQLARHPYNINQPVYQRLALHLPKAAASKLEAYATAQQEDYQGRYFKAQAIEMLRIMDLKH